MNQEVVQNSVYSQVCYNKLLIWIFLKIVMLAIFSAYFKEVNFHIKS